MPVWRDPRTSPGVSFVRAQDRHNFAEVVASVGTEGHYFREVVPTEKGLFADGAVDQFAHRVEVSVVPGGLLDHVRDHPAQGGASLLKDTA